MRKEPKTNRKCELAYKMAFFDKTCIGPNLKEFIDFDSKTSEITRFDITVYEPEKLKKSKSYTVDELTCSRTKLFDAIFYQRIRDKKSFVFDKTPEDLTVKVQPEIGMALFVVYYYMLNRGYVPSESNEDSQSIPMLLPSFVPLKRRVHTYVNDMASFDINKMDPNWLKRIKLSGLGIQTKTTLTFGVVNHELLEIFRMYQPKKWDGSYWKETYNTVLEFAVQGPSWDIFPLTSNKKKLEDFEIIKKALLGLIFQIYTDEQIETIKSIGLMPYTLTKQEALLQSRFISATEFDGFNDFMFKDDEHQRPSNGLPHGVLDFKLKTYGHFEGRKSTSTSSLYSETSLLFDTR